MEVANGQMYVLHSENGAKPHGVPVRVANDVFEFQDEGRHWFLDTDMFHRLLSSGVDSCTAALFRVGTKLNDSGTNALDTLLDLCAGAASKKRPAAASPIAASAKPFRDEPDTEPMLAVTKLTKCCVCSAPLKLQADKVERSTVVTTNGTIPVLHQKKRCTNKKCALTHANNYAQIKGVNINFCKKTEDFGNIVFVTGKNAFSLAYLQQYWARTFRTGLPIRGEGQALEDYKDLPLPEHGDETCPLHYFIISAS